MNGVIGMLQLMAMTSLDDEQLEYVETAMASGESLLTIINDILDYSKIEAGKLQMSPEEFQIREIIKPLLISFKTAINHQKVSLLCSVAPEVPNILVADHVRIRQILYNLVGNAVKFTEQGEIHIEIKTLEAIGKNLVRLECTIADTGIGTPEDIGDELFEPFTQIESPRQKKVKGTGLGLSIVKQLVARMDGIETTKIIRGSENYRHVQNIPIIALTAYAMAGDKDKCLQAGMDSYLAKPVDIKALEKRLKSLTADN